MNEKEKSSAIKDLFLSAGDGKASMSKVMMFVGLVISSGLLLYQAISKNGDINTELFIIYICATLGTNSVNKGISVYGEMMNKARNSSLEDTEDYGYRRNYRRDEYEYPGDRMYREEFEERRDERYDDEELGPRPQNY